MVAVHGGNCIELFAFGANSISSNKQTNIILRLAKVGNTFAWSHQLILITRYKFWFIYFCLVCLIHIFDWFIYLVDKRFLYECYLFLSDFLVLHSFPQQTTSHKKVIYWWVLKGQVDWGLLDQQNLFNLTKVVWSLKGHLGQWINTHWICWSRINHGIYTVNACSMAIGNAFYLL